MKSRQPTALSNLVGTMPKLSRLTHRARMLEELSRELRRCLPNDLCSHCAVANIRDHTLILVAESPAWATRVRYHTRYILRDLARLDKFDIRHIRVVIAPVSVPPEPRTEHRRLSRDAAQRLSQLADHMATGTEDRLTAALRRLASRAER